MSWPNEKWTGKEGRDLRSIYIKLIRELTWDETKKVIILTLSRDKAKVLHDALTSISGKF